MRGFVKAPAALLLSTALLGANASPGVVAVIDGARSGSLPMLRNDGNLLIAVAPLARRLGIPVKHSGGSLALRVDGTWIQIRPNDVTLREGDAPVVRLGTFPTVRGGQLFLTPSDLSAALDVDASMKNGRLVVLRKGATVATAAADDFQVTERASATPVPHVTPAAPEARGPQKRIVGNFSAQVSDYAQQRNYSALLDGGGDHFHASVYVNGISGGRSNLGGTLRLGDPGARHVSFGGVNDPLYGELFTGGGSNGVENVNVNGSFESYTTTTVDARHVFAVGVRKGGVVRELALARENGIVQPLLGIQRWNESPHFIFDRELWTGLRGVGVGVRYRTTGRIYTDNRIALTGAGLPLVAGDAMSQATIGYDVSKGFGLRIGYGASHGFAAQSMVQLYGGTPAANFTVSHYGIQNGATLEIVRGQNRIRFDYIQAPGYTGFQTDGAFDVRRGVLETRAYVASGNSTDFAADYRLKREAPSVSLGVEAVRAQNGGRIAPTIGYQFPVGGSLSLGFEFHPLPNGNGVRFTASQALYAQPAAHRHLINVALQSVPTAPVYLIVDGTRKQLLTTQTTRIAVEPGSRYLSIQSEDGKLASPEERVVDGAPDSLSFALWPVAELRGVVRLTALPLGVDRPSLEGITVVLNPQGVSTQTDRDGNFSFPSQAVDPSSSVAVDPDSLPKGFAVSDPPQVQSGRQITLLLHPSTKIEKVIF